MPDLNSNTQVSAPVRRIPGAFLRSLGVVGAFFAGLAACGAALAVFAPFPDIPSIAPKWNHLCEHREDYDSIFVGSSRFNHHVISQEFDAAVGSGRSFNFGVDACRPPESFYVTRKILDLELPRLKWVFIDLTGIRSQLEAENLASVRTAYWHDFRHTRLALAHLLETGGAWLTLASDLSTHVNLLLKRTAHQGEGSALLKRWLVEQKHQERRDPFVQTAGYAKGPDRSLKGAEREEFLRIVAEFKKGVAPVPVRPVFREALSALIADIRRAGADPIFVLGPTLAQSENFVGIPDGTPVLAFNDPNKYPALFDPDNRYDPAHLNERGARIFTARLAEEFRALIDKTP
jgi:hypothetical protein